MNRQSRANLSISQKQASRIRLCLLIVIGFIATAQPSPAADDTARFSGTWATAIPFNGQTLTLFSVHDNSGFKNYLLYSERRWPVGNGKFSAANGRYTAAAPKPNDGGTYRIIDDNTIVATNNAGQTATWKRYNAPLPPLIENGGYNYRIKPSLNGVLEAARKNLKDLVFTYIEIQGIPGNLWLQYHLYSPSTGAIVTGWAGGPSNGKYSVTNWKPHDAAQIALPIDFKVDFADAMAKLQSTGLKPVGLGVTRLEWTGATGTPQLLAWSISVGGNKSMGPMFVDAQSGALIPWQRAIDPPGGSDADIQAMRNAFQNHGQQPGQSNDSLKAMECVAGLQLGYVGC